MKVDEANLDALKGLPDVAYDFDVSAALESAFRSAATTLEDQRGSRSGYRSDALTDFAGYYSSLFSDNGTTQLSDLDEIVTNLRLVATKVTELDEKARAENDRRRKAWEWAQRRANRNLLDHAHDALFGDEELGLALHRTVHADQTFDFHRPLREGDDVVARLTIERVRNRGNLDMVTILVALTVDGEAVCDARSTLMHTRKEASHD